MNDWNATLQSQLSVSESDVDDVHAMRFASAESRPTLYIYNFATSPFPVE